MARNELAKLQKRGAWKSKVTWKNVVALPFIEALFAVIAAVPLLWVNWQYSIIVAIMGFLVSVCRLAFIQHLGEELASVSSLAEIVRMWRKIPVPDFQEMARVYMQVAEDDFAALKQLIVSDANRELHELAERKRSRELATGSYYHWLLPMLEKAQAGSEIWAVSRMLSCEWDESEAERQFIRLNQEAAERGVRLSRVFILEDESMEAILHENDNVSWHFKPELNINVYIAYKNALSQQDSRLLKDLGDGFIAFDQRVALIDRHSVDGSARGVVTMSGQEIAALRRSFDQVCLLAKHHRNT